MENKNGFLQHHDFLKATSLTQILCCDILVEDSKKRFLVGNRKNPPAQNTLFVPGGRIFKGECLKNGIDRVMEKELGSKFDYDFIGIYEHIYKNDNCLGAKDVDAHYVVFTIHVKIGNQYLDIDQLNIQHNGVFWLTPSEILQSPQVHNYTKSYFVENAINKFIGSNK